MFLKMSYTFVNLILSLPTLIEGINKKEKHNSVLQINSGLQSNGNSILFITLKEESNIRYSLEISQNGEIVYNPLVKSSILNCVFDWLLHIDRKRQNERCHKIRKELIEKVWSPENFAKFSNPDW